MSNGAGGESGDVYDTESLVGGNYQLASKSYGNTRMNGTSIYPNDGKNVVRYAWSFIQTLSEEALQCEQ